MADNNPKSEIERYIERPKGLIFTKDEYDFLHLYLIKQQSRGDDVLKSIKKKEGAGLNEQEKVFVKRMFKEYKEKKDEKT